MLSVVRRVLPIATLLSACALTAGAIVVFVRLTTASFDVTDEAFYINAADPANKANISNGLWGMYIGVVYRAVGYSLVGFRIAGGLLLAGCAGWLGWQVGRLVGISAEQRIPRIALVVSTIASAFLYYALVLLTPSYNWLALCGIMLTLSGIIGVLLGPEQLWPRVGHAVAISFGCFVTFWARNIAAITIWLLAQALILALVKGSRRTRLSLCAAGVGVLFVLAVMHSVFLLDPVTSFEAVSRARSFNFDHGFTMPFEEMVDGSIENVLMAPARIWATAGVWPLLGLLPLVTCLAPQRLRTTLAAFTSCVAFLVVGVALVGLGRFDAGVRSYTHVTPAVLALIVTAGLAWVSSSIVRRVTDAGAEGLPRRTVITASMTAVLLVCVQALYAFTSSNSLLGQMSGASVLGLLAAEILLICAVGRDRLVAAALSIAVLSPVLLGACLLTGLDEPYRNAPLAQARTLVTINQHGTQILLAPEYAAYLAALSEPARTVGFVAGTPIIDLTPFCSGVPMVLGATSPNTLVFGNSSARTATARWALEQQDLEVWRDAWVLVANPSRKRMDATEVIPAIGRRFPDDYSLVAKARAPWSGEEHQLWRPRT